MDCTMDWNHRTVICSKRTIVQLLIYISILGATLIMITIKKTDFVAYGKYVNFIRFSDVVQTQKQRQETMKQMCGKRQLLNVSSHLTDNILVDDRRQFLFCRIQKVANTNWERFLGETSGRMTEEDFINFSKKYKTKNNPSRFAFAEEYYQKIGIKPLRSYNRSEIDYRIKNYFKFVFVRHPFARLVSAYKDKFNLHNYHAKGQRKKTVKAILKNNRTGRNAKKPFGKVRVNFDEFVKFLSEIKPGEQMKVLNVHWQLRQREDRENVRKYFKNIPAETREKLIKVYSVDFDLFGYDPRSFF